MGGVNDNLVFVIAHKYVRGYVSYIKYYIDKINELYPKSQIIVVDNNSKNINDIKDLFNNYENVILLENNIECKFEIGAYQVGIDYLIEKNILHNFSYAICTQDTYLLKNKYDFNVLKSKNIKASSIIGWPNDLEKMDVMKPVLERLGLFNNLHSTNLCWCNSFVVDTDKLEQLNYLFKQIVVTTRHQSEASERYLGRILLELNGGNETIDGGDNTFIVDGVRHNCLTVDPLKNIDKYFCKKAQQKNERTIE